MGKKCSSNGLEKYETKHGKIQENIRINISLDVIPRPDKIVTVNHSPKKIFSEQ